MSLTLDPEITLIFGVSLTLMSDATTANRLALGEQNMDFTIPLFAIVSLRQVTIFEQGTTNRWTLNVGAGHGTLLVSFYIPSINSSNPIVLKYHLDAQDPQISTSSSEFISEQLFILDHYLDV